MSRSITMSQTVRMLSRALMFALLLVAPLMAMQSVNAGQRTMIGDSYEWPSGIGLVLVVSLQRS